MHLQELDSGVVSCRGLCGYQITRKGGNSWLRSELFQENSYQLFHATPQKLFEVGNIRAMFQMRNWILRVLKLLLQNLSVSSETGTGSEHSDKDMELS